jgi:hypothetical protein
VSTKRTCFAAWRSSVKYSWMSPSRIPRLITARSTLMQ